MYVLHMTHLLKGQKKKVTHFGSNALVAGHWWRHKHKNIHAAVNKETCARHQTALIKGVVHRRFKFHTIVAHNHVDGHSPDVFVSVY